MVSSRSKVFTYIGGWPKIMAKLSFGENTPRYFEFLIDSGSDYTLISQSDALVLGIHYEDIRGQESTAELADLNIIHTKKINLELKIDDITLNIPVLVAKEKVECLLGRKGVFDKFDILFQESKQQVILKKLSK